MLQRLRHRAGGQEGFTLIELLVVILIIGILAAVAIPAFLNQKGKANDANVKSDVRTAQTAEETYFTDAQLYTATPASLEAIEPTLTQAFVLTTAATNPGDGMTLAAPATAIYGGSSPTIGTLTAVAGNSFDVQATSKSGVSYGIIRNSDGTVQRVCSLATSSTNPAGCSLTGGTGTTGTW
jgi:type IV pilus assembly protein PilA